MSNRRRRPGEHYVSRGGGGGSGNKRGVLDAELTFEATATVSIWVRDPDSVTWVDSEDNQDDVACFLLNSGETIAAGRRVIIARHPDGYWEIIAINCPPEA